MDALICISKARTQLAKATNLRELVETRNFSETIRTHLKRAGESLELQNAAADIRLSSERRIGELLSGMEGSGKGGDRKSSNKTLLDLASLGISKMQSSRYQLGAVLPEEHYRKFVSQCNDEKKELTQSGMLATAKKLRDKTIDGVVFKQGSAKGVSKESSWSFIKSDCLNLPFPDDHFDLVFCSPPYEAQRSYEELEFTLSGDEYVQWAADCFMECLRVCKGLVAWVIEGSTENYAYSYTPFLLGAEVHRRGAKLRKPVVYQRNGIPGTGGPDWLRNDWEPIICATKNGRLPWSDNTAMGSPPKQNKPRNATNRKTSGERKSVVYNDPEIANPGNVIKGLVGSGSMGWKDCHKNEAPFPEWLAEFFIRSFCPTGGTVLDPFSGSGTTVAVAVRNGRNAIGSDMRDSQLWLGETRLLGLSVSERLEGQQVLC